MGSGRATSWKKTLLIRALVFFLSKMLSVVQVLVCCWGCWLSLKVWNIGFPVQAATGLFLCTGIGLRKQGDAFLLFPLYFLAERLYLQRFYTGHSPALFYASSFHAYLAYQHQSVRTTALYCVMGVAFYLWFSMQVVQSAALAAFLVLSFATEAAAAEHFGKREAHFVSSFWAFVLYDTLDPSVLISSCTGLQARITFQHVAGRAAMATAASVCAAAFLVYKTTVLSYVRSAYGRTIVFLLICACSVSLQYSICRTFFRHMGSNPLSWVEGYLLQDRAHLAILLSWLAVIPVAIAVINMAGPRMRVVLRRKLFHVVALAAFLPVAIIDAPFMTLALTAAASLATIVEVMRLMGCLGSIGLTSWLGKYTDHRDGTVIRTHIYLMFGIAFPMVMYYRRVHEPTCSVSLSPSTVVLMLTVLPGILALGVVDSAAAAFGTLFGKHKWASLFGKYVSAKTNPTLYHKTVEGTVCGAVAAILVWMLLAKLTTGETLAMLGGTWETALGSLIVLVSLLSTSLIETIVEGIDNLELPVLSAGVVYGLIGSFA